MVSNRENCLMSARFVRQSYIDRVSLNELRVLLRLEGDEFLFF